MNIITQTLILILLSIIATSVLIIASRETELCVEAVIWEV